MRCKQCGAENEMWGSARFCATCGAPLEPEQPSQPVGREQETGFYEPPAAPVQGFAPAPGVPTPNPEPKKRKKSPIGWIIAAAVAALLAVGFFTVHFWSPATCTEPETCRICHKTRGAALGHDWIDATCTEPKVCAVCGEEQGEALGHTWQAATCTEPKVCTVCGEVEGDALGHDWQAATYDAPKTCSRCGETDGNVLGWVGTPDADFASETTYIGSATGHAFVFDSPLAGCRKMTVCFELDTYTGSPFGTYAVYVHTADRGWYQAATFEVSSSDVHKEVRVPITFDDTPTIDSIMPICMKNDTYNFEYYLSVEEVQVN